MSSITHLLLTASCSIDDEKETRNDRIPSAGEGKPGYEWWDVTPIARDEEVVLEG